LVDTILGQPVQWPKEKEQMTNNDIKTVHKQLQFEQHEPN